MPALDGLRAIAVLAVIAFHLTPYVAITDPVGSVVADLLRFGWAGVDLFFVLSGFLITGILYDNRNRAGFFRAFYGRRALRILPLHLLALALVAIGYTLVGGPPARQVLASMPWHVAFLTNLRLAHYERWDAAPQGTSHLWSLAIEEQFYLLWPLVVALAAGAGRLDPRRALMAACASLIAVSFALRWWVRDDNMFAAYTLLPARMDALAVGAFVALWVRGPRGAGPALTAAAPVGLACVLALTLVGTVTIGEQSYFHPLQQTVGYTLWAVAFGALVVYAAHSSAPAFAKVLHLPPLKSIGRISFGLYVLHFPIIFALQGAGLAQAGFLPFAATVLVLTFGLAAVSWRFVERPALELKRYFMYGDLTTGKREALVAA